MDRVVIGMDPHKQSVTIEVMAPDETLLDGGRYATDMAGYLAMLRDARRWPERVWAVEGCSGIGRHIANRLLADGEQVVDVPPEAVRSGEGFHDRAGPQNRRDRRAFGRAGGDSDGRAAPGGRRRAARGAAGAGGPAPRAWRGPHADGRAFCTTCCWS